MSISEQEVKSCAEAYAAAPWGEVQDLGSVREYLNKIRNNPNGFVMEFKNSPSDLPYLYVHGINYGNDVQGLIEKDFIGERAYWRTREKAKMQKFLGDLKSATYISNIHADKTAPVNHDKKPRLKVLENVLTDLFNKYGSDAVVLFTHHSTGVNKALGKLDKTKFTLESVDYQATCDTEFNDNFQIDHLTAYIIRRS
jgi:hypothetical protein